jgi:hypothetical protein
VIAITANGMRGDIDDYRNRGSAACLTKPLDVRHFRDVVDRFLDREADGAARLEHGPANPTGPGAPPV